MKQEQEYHLNRDSEFALDGSRGLRKNSEVGGPPAAPHGAASAVEKSQAHSVLLCNFIETLLQVGNWDDGMRSFLGLGLKSRVQGWGVRDI